MVKKAFLKTVEILLVIILTAIFLFAVLPKQSSITDKEPSYYLLNLRNNDGFRNFAVGNYGCFDSTSQASNSFIRQYLPSNYDFLLCIQATPQELPLKDVTVDTIFIAGNITEVNYRLVRLYYWAV